MRTETLVFRIAAALTLVHALDDAFVHRGAGLGVGQHALAGAISIAAAVAAMVAFPRLRAREDVDAGRLGALGLSTGGDVLIEVAASRELGAVVVDGVAAASFEDWHRLRGTDIGTVPEWVMFTTVRVLSGDPPGMALEDAIARVESPALLISAGQDAEHNANVNYEAAAEGPVEHWNLPDATHTNAIHEHREAYEERVVSFFDAELR